MATVSLSNATAITKKITYNYYTTRIYTDYNNVNLKNASKSGAAGNYYININNYSYNGSSYHLEHDLLESTPTPYIVSNIRIYRPIHNIPNVESQGELVIEHIKNSNTTDAAHYTYVCIPLYDNGNGENTDLDLLVKYLEGASTTCATKLKLNSIIPRQSQCYYYDTGSKTTLFGGTSSKTVQVIVFSNPIKITSATANYISAYKTLEVSFSNTSGDGATGGTKYKITNVNGPDTLSDDNIYVDCNVGEEAEAKQQAVEEFKLTPPQIKKIFLTLIICACIMVMTYMIDLALVKNNTTNQVYLAALMLDTAAAGGDVNGMILKMRMSFYLILGLLLVVAFVFIFLGFKKREINNFLKGFYIFCAAMTALFIVNLKTMGPRD